MIKRGCRDRMIVGFTSTCATTTKVVSANSVHGEAYSIQHYVIKFVSYLQQVGGFLSVLWFPPPIKPTQYNWTIVENGVKYHKPPKW